MRITTRDFLKRLGAGGIAVASGAALGDEASDKPIAAANDVIGDPRYAGFCRSIADTAKFPVDVPSAFMRDGKVIQPARELPVFHKADVVVVGGGPAGFAAALASARTGAKTALVERYGSLGGLFTNGLVLIVIGTAEGKRGGEQRLVTRGICEEFIGKCRDIGSNAYHLDQRHGPNQPTIDPEAAKVVMDRLLRAEKNLEVFFHSWGVDVIQDGPAVQGVVFESKQGRQAILAKRVVDCSGDGDAAFQAGADFRQITHALGFVTRFGNIGHATQEQMRAKAADGFPKTPNEPAPGAFWRNRLGPKGNGLSVRELTAAEFGHREENWELLEKMRRTPGFEDTFIMHTCSQIGVRASRLIKTDHTLTMAETIEKAHFEDTIGMSGDDTFTRGAFEIPYRSLLPTGIDNLLVAGRAVGVAPNVIDRARLIPVCMVTGEAAGTAAAMSVEADCTPRALDTKALRAELARRNVCLS